MDPFNNPNVPNNPNNPNNPTEPNVFSVRGYYPTIEPNKFSQYPSNAFATFQHSPNQFSQYSSNAFAAFQHSTEPDATRTIEPDEDVEVISETQPQKEKGKRRKDKQVVGEKPFKAKARPWTPIEEEALTKAYIGTSTRPTKVLKITFF
ncbi:hypothetical protein Hanom_Chr05g00386731 [Helianthus anomalus]